MWFTKPFRIICSAQRQILLDWLIHEKQLILKKIENCFYTLILLYWIFLAVVNMTCHYLQKSLSSVFGMHGFEQHELGE